MSPRCFSVFQGMTELPDYNKITFPEMPPIPLEKLVPDATSEVCSLPSSSKRCYNKFFIIFLLFQAVELLKKFLVYPSKSRIAAAEVSRNLILNFVWKWRLNKLEHLFQALLHPYFFKEPLPAHHSELPIPARNSRRLGTRAAVGKLFDTEAPLEKSLVPPNDIKPYIRKWLAACFTCGLC